MMTQSESIKCAECGTVWSDDDIFVIDEDPVCRRCLFDDIEPLRVFPIGFVSRTSDGKAAGAARPSLDEKVRIELLPSQRRFMLKLDEETHLTIVYFLHKAGPVKTTFNRRLDGKKVGVFASRTPHRLARIAVQDVRLLDVEGTTLTVTGLDAMDRSPVLDIKASSHRN